MLHPPYYPPVTNRLPVLRRIGKALILAVFGLLLTAFATWVGAYFWLGSTPGRAQLRAVVADMSPVLGVEFVRWGPSPDRLIVGPSRVDNVDGTPLAALHMAHADLAFWALVGGDLRVERLRIELSHVHANIGPDGRVDLLVVLAPPKKPPSTAAAGPKKPAPTLRIDDLDVHIGALVVTNGPGEGLVVRDVDVHATVVLGDTFRLSSHLSLGPIDATWDRARKYIAFDSLELASFEVDGPTVQARGLTLTRAGEVILAAEFVSRPGNGGAVSINAALAPSDAAALLPDAFPAGLDIQGLELEFHPASKGVGAASPDPSTAAPAAPPGSLPTLHAPTTAPPATAATVGQRLSGRLGHLRAPAWRISAFSADHLELSLDRFEVELDRLIPRVALDIGHVAAARFSGLGWNLEGLYLPGGHLDFTRRLELSLGPGRISGWTLDHDDLATAPNPSDRADPMSADIALTADLGLTGGPIHARLGGDFGTIDAVGRLKLSPLTGRTSFNTTVRFADLAGPPLAALAHDLDDLSADLRTRLEGSRPSGHAVFELEVERDRETQTWETTVTWDEGSFAIPGWLLLWDGYAWAEADPSSASTSPEDESGDPSAPSEPDEPSPGDDP